MREKIEELSILGIIIIFFLIYTTLTFLKHSHFGTSAFDLGIFDQVVWRYSTFQTPYSSLKGMIILGDHFAPVLLLFAPFYWIWSDPRTLLILQSLLVCLSVWPIYKIAKEILKIDSKLSVISYPLFAISYLIYIGLQNALDFDFHPATISIFFLGFTFYSLLLKRWPLYWLFLSLALLTQEDVPPVIMTLGLYEIFFLRKFRLGLLTFLVSMTYFFLVTYKLMPIFSSQIAGGYINFGELGGTPMEVAAVALKRPDLVMVTFLNPSVKRETLWVMLKSFGFLPIFSFFTWLNSSPYLAGRFLSTAPLRWELGFHYSVNIAPILAVGASSGINNLSRLVPSRKSLIIFFSVFIMFAFSLGVNNQYRPLIYRFFEKTTYKTDQGTLDARKVLRFIPKHSSVSAQSPFVPHLSQRDKIYLYPEKKDGAEYMILSLDKSTYPLHWHEMKREVEELLRDKRFELMEKENNTYLFKMTNNQ